jgi:hypothetical protein
MAGYVLTNMASASGPGKEAFRRQLKLLLSPECAIGGAERGPLLTTARDQCCHWRIAALKCPP